MNTGSIQDIYSAIFAGQRVKMSFNSALEYHRVRTALCRLNRNPRFLLEITDDSICSSFNGTIAEFWMGKPARLDKQYSFQILPEED